MSLHNVAERIKFLIDQCSQGKVARFARDAGMSRPALYDYVAGRSAPSAEALARIQMQTGCDLNWLLTGAGNAFRETATHKPAYSSDGYVDIPLVSPRLAGGTGAVVLSEKVIKHVKFEAAWINSFAQVKDLRLFIVTGDSMRPTILSGDMVLVDLARTEMTEDGIFAISRYGELQIKRLRWSDNGAVEIVSDNPDSPNRTVSNEADGFRIIGKVVWLAREVE